MQIQLSNGQGLEPGCKVRVPSALIWEIPNCVVHMLGIQLGDDCSHDSEVIIWPVEK